jgi:hypothetical protein
VGTGPALKNVAPVAVSRRPNTLASFSRLDGPVAYSLLDGLREVPLAGPTSAQPRFLSRGLPLLRTETCWGAPTFFCPRIHEPRSRRRKEADFHVRSFSASLRRRLRARFVGVNQTNTRFR